MPAVSKDDGDESDLGLLSGDEEADISFRYSLCTSVVCFNSLTVSGHLVLPSPVVL